MNTKITIFTLLPWLLLYPAFVQSMDFKDAKISHVEYPAWFHDTPFLELDQDLADARAAGKLGLMIFYTTEGCSYCAVFVERSLGDPAIATLVKKQFTSIGLEIFNDANLTSPRGQETTVKDFAKKEGVIFAPTLLFYDLTGKRVLRITGYQSPDRFKTSLDYVTGKHYLTKTFAEYVKARSKGKSPRVINTNLRKDTLFSQPPHLLQRNILPSHEPLLVIFDKTGNDKSEIFHKKVLADKQVRESLKKYQVVRLDRDDNKSIIITPNGSKMTASDWYEQEDFSRTPALLFISEQGQTVIKTDALVLQSRMMNLINYTNERIDLKGWSYQRFARTEAIKRRQNKDSANSL